MNTETPILELIGIDVGYGKLRALHGVSLRVHRGEVVALLGANGAGKTTTLRAISGLLVPTAGEILFDGKSIAGRRPDLILRDGIAQSPEERHGPAAHSTFVESCFSLLTEIWQGLPSSQRTFTSTGGRKIRRAVTRRSGAGELLFSRQKNV